jgi:hypothetical protein
VTVRIAVVCGSCLAAPVRCISCKHVIESNIALSENVQIIMTCYYACHQTRTTRLLTTAIGAHLFC